MNMTQMDELDYYCASDRQLTPSFNDCKRLYNIYENVVKDESYTLILQGLAVELIGKHFFFILPGKKIKFFLIRCCQQS